MPYLDMYDFHDELHKHMTIEVKLRNHPCMYYNVIHSYMYIVIYKCMCDSK